jgi:regulator of protease activity HflC (stomatin/prohibitin superfamily)
MIESLIDAIVKVTTYLWPFRIVRADQRGVYLVNGKPWRTRIWFFSDAPGLKLVIPFFCTVESYAVNARLVSLPRQSITLADGRALIFQAILMLQVEDVWKAELDVSDFIEASQEEAAGILAERLMTTDASRIGEAAERGRLLAGLTASLNAELAKFGIRCLRLRFAQFAIGAKTYRLFNDTTTSSSAFDA